MLMLMSLFCVCFASIYAQFEYYPDCQHPVTGERIPNGGKFTRKPGDCIEYTCNNGGYRATTIECKTNDNGICVALGESIVEKCRTQKCVEKNGYYGLDFTDTKCEGDGGQCYKPGEEFTRTVNGIAYKKTTCTVDGTTVRYIYTNHNQDCQHPDTGERIPNGGNFKQKSSGDCIEYTCKNGGYRATTIECKNNANGECVALGETVVEKCRTQKCVENNGFYGLDVTDTKCEGDGGQCYKPGEEFTKTFSTTGTVYKKTTCTLEGNGVRYVYRN